MFASDLLRRVTLRATAHPWDLWVDGPEELALLRGVMGLLLQPPYAPRIAQALLERSGFGANDISFRYAHPDRLDPGEAPFEGVELEIVDEVALVPADEFERLMTQALRLMITSRRADPRCPPLPPELEPLVQALEDRVRTQTQP